MSLRQLDAAGTVEVWSRYMLAFYGDQQFYCYEWFHEAKPARRRK